MQETPEHKDDKQRVPPEKKKKFSNLVKFLARAIFQSHDFGIDHPLAKKPIEQCFTLLESMIQEEGEIPLYIAEKKMRYREALLEENNPVVDRLIELCTAIQVVSVLFKKGFSNEDFLKFMKVFSMGPKAIIDSGGVEKLVQESSIANFEINPIRYELIGKDQKVIAGQDGVTKDARAHLQEQFKFLEDSDALDGDMTSLLMLIDPALKQEAAQSLFVEMLLKDPSAEVYSIIEAIQLVDKAGANKGKGIVDSIINKMSLVRDDLYGCLLEGKEDEYTQGLYQAAEVLGQELPKQLGELPVSTDMRNQIEQMNNILTMIMDQTEGQKLISAFMKGKRTLKDKAMFLQRVADRQRVSEDFEFFIKKVLVLKGMSQEEVDAFFAERETILEKFERMREVDLKYELSPLLNALTKKEVTPDEVLTKLDIVVSTMVDAQVQSQAQGLQQENEKLVARTEMFNAAFGALDEGAVVFDNAGSIIFTNDSANRLIGTLQANKTMDKQLLAVLQNWQKEKKSSAEKLLGQDAKLDKEKSEKLNHIINNVKRIQKDQKSEFTIAIFKPSP